MATGVFVRRAEFDDQQAIRALVGEDAATVHKRFLAGDNITSMIETASLGITAVNEKGDGGGVRGLLRPPRVPRQGGGPGGVAGMASHQLRPPRVHRRQHRLALLLCRRPPRAE